MNGSKVTAMIMTKKCIFHYNFCERLITPIYKSQKSKDQLQNNSLGENHKRTLVSEFGSLMVKNLPAKKK